MATDDSYQFREPAYPDIDPSSSTASTVSNASSTANSTSSAPPERQSSVSKIASVAKNLVKSPQEEKEHLQLEKTLDRDVKKGSKADVGMMEA